MHPLLRDENVHNECFIAEVYNSNIIVNSSITGFTVSSTEGLQQNNYYYR